MTTPAEPIVYHRLSPEHVHMLSRFHTGNLGGKLSVLGPSFVRYFYTMAMELKGTFGWGAFQKEDIVGFVFGSLLGESILKKIIQRAPLRWGGQALISACLHPQQFGRVALGVLKSSPAEHPGAEEPELHYIAVRADQRGHHIGNELTRRFCQDLADHDRFSFRLSVGQDNTAAIRFYEAHGGQALYDYETSGLKLKRFTFDVRAILHKEP